MLFRSGGRSRVVEEGEERDLGEDEDHIDLPMHVGPSSRIRAELGPRPTGIGNLSWDFVYGSLKNRKRRFSFISRFVVGKTPFPKKLERSRLLQMRALHQGHKGP